MIEFTYLLQVVAELKDAARKHHHRGLEEVGRMEEVEEDARRQHGNAQGLEHARGMGMGMNQGVDIGWIEEFYGTHMEVRISFLGDESG
jgi:hypothetical protein